MNRFRAVLKDINELIVFKHSVFAMPFIFIAMIIASYEINDSAWFGFRLLILGLICAVSARSFAMAVNRFADKDIDALNPRTANRPSVDGRIGRLNMAIFIIFNALLFVFAAWLINEAAFIASFPILIILASYSFFKRFSALAHLVLGLSLGLAPIAGSIAVLGYMHVWSWLLCFGIMFWVAGFDLLYSLQDIEFDKKHGLHSIPSRYGKDAALAISAGFHTMAVIFWLLFAAAASLNFFSYAAVAVSAAILFCEHVIVRRDFKKIDRAFFTLNGYLGILFFIFVWIDIVFMTGG
ncbi:MAG: 4-hydroxybenzoate polyprenyltransferase [Campylobacteraceae bacterium]|jgi:4-hydroxybenzoate polyprenyltransferase|nr:4-hydroxybenzoate polyprenyltransferase [Campylobacteraceae bacterium]